ncbi:sporulation YhaL family protein [Pontibacillus salicampi]|uniref:Sporulation YhaL family protein n=1 Tax=Pontibacillus salicampi TaxID=1449801 RepID=A0ABV6LM57_9BACI
MMIAGFPWWVLATVAIIIFCGYMAFRAIREEKRIESHFIEQEGEKYMRRIEKEREAKEEDKKEHSVASGS